MDFSLFLNVDYSNAFYEKITPHYTHSKIYIQIAQCIAAIDRELETPHFELCLRNFKKMDPGDIIPQNLLFEELSSFFELDTELTPYASHLKNLYEIIEKEKKSLIRLFRKLLKNMPDDFVCQIKKKIKSFHEKKDIACNLTLHQLEFILEKRRLDKIKRQLS
jgi:hypothetical protein